MNENVTSVLTAGKSIRRTFLEFGNREIGNLGEVSGHINLKNCVETGLEETLRFELGSADVEIKVKVIERESVPEVVTWDRRLIADSNGQ